MGPLAGWVIKQFDKFMEDKMPAGFEMLINNFSVGILGMLLAIFGSYIMSPLMTAIMNVLTAGVNALVNAHLLPLAAIFIEPAKVLFLNNAINHGIFTPIGATQVEAAGKSIMYMLEANPGHGLGVLIAYMFFAKDETTKQSAPGAIIIHFLGGIHEIYFPYVLMNPIVIIAPIVGNIVAIAFFSIFNVGLVGPSSPGSIIAFLSVAPRDQIILVLAGVLIAAAVSFLVASPIIRFTDKGGSLEDAQADMSAMKAEAKGQKTVSAGTVKNPGDIKMIIFACDAGMGSSAMGATKFRNRIKAIRPDITVKNTSVDNIPAGCDIAVVQTILADRARKSCPGAQIVEIGNFLADPALDNLFMQISTGDTMVTAAPEKEDIVEKVTKPDVFTKEGILLNQKAATKEEAIRQAGQLLVDRGCVDPSYIDAMLEREKIVTTYMGMGLAIPHGTTQAKGTVKKTGIVFVQYPDGVPFGDEKAQLVFGIAGIGDEHLDMLAKVANALDDEEVIEKMKTTNDVNWILKQLS
jgi:PTS system mannitol-specific IIC component